MKCNGKCENLYKNIIIITDYVPFRYGEKYPLMTGCQNISEPFCDLSSVMDIRKKYFIKVLADELCLGELIHFVPVKESKAFKIEIKI